MVKHSKIQKSLITFSEDCNGNSNSYFSLFSWFCEHIWLFGRTCKSLGKKIQNTILWSCMDPYLRTTPYSNSSSSPFLPSCTKRLQSSTVVFRFMSPISLFYLFFFFGYHLKNFMLLYTYLRQEGFGERFFSSLVRLHYVNLVKQLKKSKLKELFKSCKTLKIYVTDWTLLLVKVFFRG